jgi:hypothetical protein
VVLLFYLVIRDGILERHFYSEFLGINSSLPRLEFFVRFSSLIFLFNEMLFMSRLEFSYFADIFVRIFQNREEFDFL